MPKSDKANQRFVAVQDKPARSEREWLAVESGTAKIISVEPQKQPVAAVRAERKPPAGRTVNGDERLDRGKLVSSSLDTAVVVGRDQAFLTGRRIGADCVEPVAVSSKAGRFDRNDDLACWRRIVADQFERRDLGLGTRGQSDRLAIERPLALRLFGDRAVVQLVTEMAVLLQLQGSADLHLLRLV